ncbi:MAG: putative kinase [bacterium]|jgi:predicted kinase
MQAIIFTGIQATGKSTFYQQNFFKTHMRINLDMLRTRNREKILFEACIKAKQPLVIDNTNPTEEQRAKYITILKEAGFEIHGYYFRSRIEDSLRLNAKRTGKEVIPEVGIRATLRKLERLNHQEGFDKLFYVFIHPKRGGFHVREWDQENSEVQ